MPDLWALVIDDGRSEVFYDAQFDANAQRRAEAGFEGRITRFGAVRRSPRAGRHGVLEALNGDFALDLVIIDHRLSDGETPPRQIAGGISLMRWIQHEYEQRERLVPPCVLWTAEYTPQLAHTFVLAGGRHAFPHTGVLEEIVDELWSVADGSARWRPVEHPACELTDEDRELLPYLAADWPNHRIAEDLSRRHGESVSQELVTSRRRAMLQKRVNPFRREQNSRSSSGRTSPLR